MERALEQRALPQREPSRRVAGRSLPRDDGHLVAARCSCEPAVTGGTVPWAVWSKQTNTAPTV